MLTRTRTTPQRLLKSRCCLLLLLTHHRCCCLATTSTTAHETGAILTWRGLQMVSVHRSSSAKYQHSGATSTTGQSRLINCSAEAGDTEGHSSWYGGGADQDSSRASKAVGGSSWYDGGADQDRPRRQSSSFSRGRGRGGSNRSGRQQELQPGDWVCSDCGEMNFARR